MSNEANIILGLLSSDSMVTHSKLIAHAIGLNEAVAYASLIAKFAYYERNNLLDEEGYFYCTAIDLEETTCLKRRQQEKAIKVLKENNLIFYKIKGIPAKRYFKINCDTDVIKEVINKGLERDKELKNARNSENKNVQNVQTRKYETCKQESTKCTSSNVQNVHENININIKSKYKDINNNINTTTNNTTNTKYSKSTNKENDSGSSGLDADDNNKEVYDLYLQEISRDKLGLSALTIDCLRRLIAEYSGEKVIEAIKISVYQNKRSLRYIEGVLKKQKKEGKESVKPKRDTKQEIDWSEFD